MRVQYGKPAVADGEIDAGVVTVPNTRTNVQTKRGGRTSALIEWLESHALYVAAVAAVTVVSLAQVYLHIAQDSWLAVLAGRIIASHGIPHHDYLTVMTHGVRWVDQQWLAQLAMYDTYRVGGLALLSIGYVALTAGAFAVGIGAARNLGGTERSVVVILPFAAFFYMVSAVSIRTQGFAYPMFATTLWLLASDVRRPSGRRVFLVFPVLVLWANLHGSVTLGVGIAVIYGAVTIADSWRARGARGVWHARGLAFTLGAPLTLLATPYGLGVIHYYQSTLLNPEFSKLITEWRPVTSLMLLAVPYLLVMVVVIWVLGRSGRKTPTFDHLVLGMLALGGVLAVRNVTWFGFGAVILGPATIAQAMKVQAAAPRRRRLNLTLAGVSMAVVALVTVSTATRPEAWFEQTYDQRAIPAVATIVAHHPGTKIFADVRFADWLVWHDPALAGHVAFDTSFELLTAHQLETLSDLGEARLPGQADPLARYGVFVLDPKNKAGNRQLLDRPGVRIVLRSKRVIVATKPVT